MIRSRALTGTLLLVLTSNSYLVAQVPTLATRPGESNVVPIPLAFEDEREEPAAEVEAQSDATADEISAVPNALRRAETLPIPENGSPSGIELTPPARQDPFSQPGFDPFDDEQFRPRTTDAPAADDIAPLPLPHRNDAPSNQPPVVPDFPNQDFPSPDFSSEQIQPEALGSDLNSFTDDAQTLTDSEGRQTIRERYTNGAIKLERQMIQDSDENYIHDGTWRWFSPKGEVMADGDYVRNERQGLWRRVYLGNESKIFKSSPYTQFTPPFTSEATFAQGKLHGAWTIYDAKQRKISDIFYENGQRHGPAIWWQSNGTPAIQAQFQRGELHGEAFVFDAHGKVVRREVYDKGWKYERKTEKYNNGRPKEISNWLGGHWKLVGDDDWWNASIASFEVSESAVRHGQQVAYFPNGQLRSQQEFDHGKPKGELLYWHENGQRALIGRYNETGKPDGKWTWWHANGMRSISGEYLAGASQGDWTWWNEEGKVTRRGELTAMPSEAIAVSPRGTTLGRPRPVE